MIHAMNTLLHIGASVRAPGWTNIDIRPGPDVDIVADCSDLSAVPDGSCAVVYASHVFEHVRPALHEKTLSGFRRVLAPGGQLMISVPDMEKICQIFVRSNLHDRRALMWMIYGGHSDVHDEHHFGFTHQILGAMLHAVGLVDIAVVDYFNLFDDSSRLPISLNMTARRPAAP